MAAKLHRYLPLQSSLWCLRGQQHVTGIANGLIMKRLSSSLTGEGPDSIQHDINSHINAAALENGSTMYFNNRNPRSLELLGVAEKPKGFVTTNKRVDYYHRLMLDITSRHVSAYVNHNNGLKVVEASTREFCIAKHLYKTSDVAAAFNIGRVIATRCKESGLYRVMWEHKWDRKHKKVVAFIKGVKNGGLILNEPRPRKTLPPAGTLP